MIANELLDNLPSAMAVRTRPVGRAASVGENGGVLALMTAQARPEVASWADRFAGPVTMVRSSRSNWRRGHGSSRRCDCSKRARSW